MDSQEGDFFHDCGGDWAEEAPDGIDITINEPTAAAAPKPYKILNKKDIKNIQENDISTISTVLSVSRGIACSLLCRNNWNLTAALDQWFAAAKPPPEEGSTSKHLCNICSEETSPRKMASAACGHLFCSDYWETYIATAIGLGAACLIMPCPEPGCGAAVTSDMVEEFASESKIKKYNQHLRRSYVELNRHRKWCPSPGCGRAIEFDSAGTKTYDVVCDCSHSFCFRCLAERHRPVACKAVAEWLEKNKSEGEKKSWRNAKSDMNRYAHYYKRWESNEKSRKMAVENSELARGRCGGGEMKFVAAAWEQIVECRRVLKWSYVYGYYLAGEEGKTALFEHMKGEAEAALERLHRCVEREIRDESVYVDREEFRGFRVKLLDLTSATSKYFENFVVALENNLAQDSSSSGCSDSSDSEYEKSRRHKHSSSSFESECDSSESDSEHEESEANSCDSSDSEYEK